MAMNTPAQPTPTGAAGESAADAARLRREQLRAALGNPLPEQTSDDIVPGQSDTTSDAEYVENLPPHHGRV